MYFLNIFFAYIGAFKKVFFEMDLQESILSIAPLHHYPEYTMHCCRLLNDEWKRSDSARLHSLKNSCDSLPTSLILLKDKELIGHCKLSSIPSIKDACFIESVVIDKNLRGKGYGSFLIQKAEEYCKCNLNMRTIYLSTIDRVSFYFKLGYVQCDPVSIYGSSQNNINVNSSNYISSSSLHVSNKENIPSLHPPPLPPPPLNLPAKFPKKIFMKHQI